jgi:hypothetical protein
LSARAWVRTIIAGVAAAAALMVVEISWHDAVFGGYYDSIPYVTREPADFTAPTVGFVVRGLMLSFLFERFSATGASLRSGLFLGLVVGLLTAVYWVPSFYAQHAVPAFAPWLALEGLFFLLQGAVAGLAVALILRRQVHHRVTS